RVSRDARAQSADPTAARGAAERLPEGVHPGFRRAKPGEKDEGDHEQAGSTAGRPVHGGSVCCATAVFEAGNTGMYRIRGDENATKPRGMVAIGRSSAETQNSRLAAPMPTPLRVAFVRPGLGIGGAERLRVDAPLQPGGRGPHLTR